MVAEFEKEILDGKSQSKISCVLSDSGWCISFSKCSSLDLLNWAARQEEEEFRLVSLFKSKYRPNAGTSHECSFEIMHPNLSFVFDEPQRGPQGRPFSREI